jgi:DNA topoisomerase-1
LGTLLFASGDEKKIARECPECRQGELSLKMGRFGSFIGCSRYPECKYVKKLDSSTASEGDGAMASSAEYPKFLGVDPLDQSEITLRNGLYGFYVQRDVKGAPPKSSKKTPKEKPPRSSVPKFIDHNNVNLDLALSLLQLPKTLGQHEGEDVKIGIGRFGPYVLFKGKYTSIAKSETDLNMNLKDAYALLKK